MSNNSNDAGRGNVDRRAHRGGSGSSSVTLKQKRLLKPKPNTDTAMLDEYDDGQRSMPSALDSFSSAPSPSLAVEVEVARSSERFASPSRDQHQSNKKAWGKKYGGVVVAGARRQLPLSEVVSRRAFECVMNTSGELSKLIDVAEDDSAAVKSQGDHHCAKPTNTDAFKNEETDRSLRRTCCERSPTSANRLEALPYGAGISIDSQVGTGEETRPSQQQCAYNLYQYVHSCTGGRDTPISSSYGRRPKYRPSTGYVRVRTFGM